MDTAKVTSIAPLVILKEYMELKEEQGIAERRLEELKIIVDGLRGPEKKTFYRGTLHKYKGDFVINHVDSRDTKASVAVLDEWLIAGKISQADYDDAVKTKPKEYNLVTFQKV